MNNKLFPQPSKHSHQPTSKKTISSSILNSLKNRTYTTASSSTTTSAPNRDSTTSSSASQKRKRPVAGKSSKQFLKKKKQEESSAESSNSSESDDGKLRTKKFVKSNKVTKQKTNEISSEDEEDESTSSGSSESETNSSSEDSDSKRKSAHRKSSDDISKTVRRKRPKSDGLKIVPKQKCYFTSPVVEVESLYNDFDKSYKKKKFSSIEYKIDRFNHHHHREVDTQNIATTDDKKKKSKPQQPEPSAESNTNPTASADGKDPNAASVPASKLKLPSNIQSLVHSVVNSRVQDDKNKTELLKKWNFEKDAEGNFLQDDKNSDKNSAEARLKQQKKEERAAKRRAHYYSIGSNGPPQQNNNSSYGAYLQAATAALYSSANPLMNAYYQQYYQNYYMAAAAAAAQQPSQNSTVPVPAPTPSVTASATTTLETAPVSNDTAKDANSIGTTTVQTKKPEVITIDDEEDEPIADDKREVSKSASLDKFSSGEDSMKPLEEQKENTPQIAFIQSPSFTSPLNFQTAPASTSLTSMQSPVHFQQQTSTTPLTFSFSSPNQNFLQQHLQSPISNFKLNEDTEDDTKKHDSETIKPVTPHEVLHEESKENETSAFTPFSFGSTTPLPTGSFSNVTSPVNFAPTANKAPALSTTSVNNTTVSTPQVATETVEPNNTPAVAEVTSTAPQQITAPVPTNINTSSTSLLPNSTTSPNTLVNSNNSSSQMPLTAQQQIPQQIPQQQLPQAMQLQQQPQQIVNSSAQNPYAHLYSSYAQNPYAYYQMYYNQYYYAYAAAAANNAAMKTPAAVPTASALPTSTTVPSSTPSAVTTATTSGYMNPYAAYMNQYASLYGNAYSNALLQQSTPLPAPTPNQPTTTAMTTAPTVTNPSAVVGQSNAVSISSTVMEQEKPTTEHMEEKKEQIQEVTENHAMEEFGGHIDVDMSEDVVEVPSTSQEQEQKQTSTTVHPEVTHVADFMEDVLPTKETKEEVLTNTSATTDTVNTSTVSEEDMLDPSIYSNRNDDSALLEEHSIKSEVKPLKQSRNRSNSVAALLSTPKMVPTSALNIVLGGEDDEIRVEALSPSSLLGQDEDLEDAQEQIAPEESHVQIEVSSPQQETATSVDPFSSAHLSAPIQHFANIPLTPDAEVDIKAQDLILIEQAIDFYLHQRVQQNESSIKYKKFMAERNRKIKSKWFRDHINGREVDSPSYYYPIMSPYSLKILPAFIRRDTETISNQTKLMIDLSVFHYGHEECHKYYKIGSIDYCYLQEWHIPQVNQLLRRFYWSNIDISSMLKYPEFTVVCMYKKLVVGCAFLKPIQNYIPFICVHPQWLDCGIYQFMLYHILYMQQENQIAEEEDKEEEKRRMDTLQEFSQTLQREIKTSNIMLLQQYFQRFFLHRDVTAHVSVNNEFMIALYQMFGFQQDQLHSNFYEKFFYQEREQFGTVIDILRKSTHQKGGMQHQITYSADNHTKEKRQGRKNFMSKHAFLMRLEQHQKN